MEECQILTPINIDCQIMLLLIVAISAWRFIFDELNLSSAANIVFFMSMATVMGPTPPGTGDK